MRKWEALAQKTYEDIKKEKIKNRKRADNDYAAVVIENSCRIKKRIGRA